MKKRLLVFSFLAFAFSAQAQLDTILHEDFQVVDIFLEWQNYTQGDDLVWTHFDQDGIEPNNGDEQQWGWFSTTEFWPDTAVNSNFVAASYSWLAGSVNGNRNWLNTPPLAIPSANTTLHWKSASLQLPRYMDGCQVLVSTTGNNPEDFTDTLFTTASMTGIIGSGNVPVVDSFEFSPGYIHANSLQDSAYWDYYDNLQLMHGILEPHSVSLAAYAGQSIYIAWLHDSDDDYYFSIDDVLVVDGAIISATDPTTADLRFVTYPNPADDLMNLLYRLDNQAVVQFQVVDAAGRTVLSSNRQTQSAGEYSTPVNLSRLAAGNYLMVLKVDDKLVSGKFVKR